MNQSAPAPAPSGGKSPPWRKMIPLAVVLALAAAAFALDLHTYLSFDTLKTHRETILAWTDANRVPAVAAFIAGYALAVALSLPGATVMTLGGGFVFGLWAGSAMVVCGATAGAVAVFLIARYALRDFFMAKTGGAVRRMEAGFNENALSYMLVLRLIPLFPFWLVNLVPAFLGVPLRTYIIGTAFGIMPGSIVFCSVGAGLGAVFDRGETPDLGVFTKPEILLPIAGLAVLSLAPVIYKRMKARRAPK